MVKIKEGFKGERLVSLPEELLASYRREPLINNLYVRKIGFFPRVKYHFLQKEHGCDYAMLIYCTEGKDGIVSSVNNIPWRNTNISSSSRYPLLIRGRRGRSMDYLLVTLPREASRSIPAVASGSGHYFAE